MKKLVFAFLLLLVVGCATSKPVDYDKVWAATERVLIRNQLMVQESQYREDTMVAVSQVHGDFLNKTRVKVVARVEENDEGYAEPSIRVLNQWDNSEAKTWAQSEYQTGTKWINLSNNAAMEARLFNEIMAELGKRNMYQGKAWQPPYNDQVVSGPRPVSAEPVPLLPDEE